MAPDLCYYTLAYRILLFPIQNISGVISRVMFPIYSRFQEDNKRFVEAYFKVAKIIAFISFPLMMGVMALAKPLVLTFLGPKWEPVILLIMILAPVGLVQSIGTTTCSIYQAKGRTDWMFRWGVAAGIVVVAAFSIGIKWGIVGVAVAYAIASILILGYPNFAIPFRLINLNSFFFLRELKIPLLNSFIVTLVLFAYNFLSKSYLSNFQLLLSGAFLAFMLYGILSLKNNKEIVTDIVGFSPLLSKYFFK